MIDVNLKARHKSYINKAIVLFCGIPLVIVNLAYLLLLILRRHGDKSKETMKRFQTIQNISVPAIVILGIILILFAKATEKTTPFPPNVPISFKTPAEGNPQ